MPALRMVPVPLGWSARAGGSRFHSSPFAATPRTALGRARMGETEQAWYARAKAAVVKYDDLADRARRIASPQAREGLLARFAGNPADTASAMYRRNSVAYNVAEAESYTPINYLVFQPDRVRNRVEKLDQWNRDFEAALAEAERTYDVLPGPVVVERTVRTAAPAPLAADLTVPLVVGGALLAALAVFYFVG